MSVTKHLLPIDSFSLSSHLLFIFCQLKFDVEKIKRIKLLLLSLLPCWARITRIANNLYVLMKWNKFSNDFDFIHFSLFWFHFDFYFNCAQTRPHRELNRKQSTRTYQHKLKQKMNENRKKTFFFFWKNRWIILFSMVVGCRIGSKN